MTDASLPTRGTVGTLIGPRGGDPIEVELFVRSLAPFGTRSTLDNLIDRLDRLSERGVIDSLRVRVWGKALRPDDAGGRVGGDHGLVDRVLDLFSFAAESSCSIGRYFRVATDGSLVDADPRQRLVPPRRCLSIRRDGDIVAVFPCDVGAEHFTPADAVEYLETGGSERRLASATSG